MPEVDVATEIRRLADEIRTVADGGLLYAAELPYDAARYRHFRRIAAELMSLVDERDGETIERELFSALSHLAPIPAVSAAVFDDANRILLIRRSDNGHWEMPGGALDPGQSPAEAAQREAAEEAGVLVTPIELITVIDTRLEHSSPLQLVHIGFLCRHDGDLPGGPATPYEVTAIEWFARDDLPDLRPHHARRIEQAFAFQATRASERRTSFDEVRAEEPH